MPEPPTLPLEAYRDAIGLYEPFAPPPAAGPEELQGLATLAARYLTSEPWAASQRIGADQLPEGYPRLRSFLKGLLTLRPPHQIAPAVLVALDRILQCEAVGHEVHDALSMPRIRDQFPKTTYPAADKTALWQGDITTLRVDAVVNAANRQMLGCFQPFHDCIDNVIHSRAGPRLRGDCHAIMEFQGRPEPTGGAKVTRAYHLPSRYVLHTVGPIVGVGRSRVGGLEESQLESCYAACLDLAAQVVNLRSVAFCCISTGVFGYPPEQAAQTALKAVAAWLSARPDALDLVVFNVFRPEDLDLYRALLRS